MELLAMLGPWQIMLVLIAALPLVVLPIIALVDILRHEFTGSNKIVWVLVVIFFPFIGSLLYFMIGRDQRIQE